MKQGLTGIAVGCVLSLSMLAASCAPSKGSARPPPSSPQVMEAATAKTSDVPMSEPAEYVEQPVSAQAGGDYFLRIGVGDPYAAGIAYPVLLAFMEAYPDALGRDWNELADRFGFIRDPEAKGDPKAPPIGFHLTVDPKTRVPWVVNNCQMCHADRLRLASGDVVVAGMGSKRVRPHAYTNALLRIGGDPALDEKKIETLAAERAREWNVPWDPAMRRPIVKATLAGLRDLAAKTEADSARFEGALPGRAATIESFAMALNTFAGDHIPLPAAPGWAKVPDVVGAPYRTTLSYDASGSGTPEGLALEASFVFGTRPAWYVAHPNIAGSMVQYLRSFRRHLPYPHAVDAGLVTRGRTQFTKACAGCHGTYVAHGDETRVLYREKVVPEDFVGTDSARIDAVTPAFVAAANALPLTQGLTTVKNTGGYVPPVLLDVWARGLLGHAGQWPSLEALGTLPEARPRRFIVDTEGAYDLDRVGVRYEVVPASQTPRALRPGEYLYDGSAPGLGVGGHPFLAELADEDRRSIMEYLKTL